MLVSGTTDYYCRDTSINVCFFFFSLEALACLWGKKKAGNEGERVHRKAGSWLCSPTPHHRIEICAGNYFISAIPCALFSTRLKALGGHGGHPFRTPSCCVLTTVLLRRGVWAVGDTLVSRDLYSPFIPSIIRIINVTFPFFPSLS
jgi:hypothetical protein